MELILTTFYLFILENVTLKKASCPKEYFGDTRDPIEHLGESNIFHKFYHNLIDFLPPLPNYWYYINHQIIYSIKTFFMPLFIFINMYYVPQETILCYF